ncbi:DUF2750 domain-containing protein [Oerskovia flava]|uniref:DUF2750 domain-containing protein n=1 Tax=Oerskovia flava TaxID=2986422 RepID=UPI00224079AE|nr:DUF2750 domain-containing protein [Oerskovia sp. JB1-3-2]
MSTSAAHAAAFYREAVASGTVWTVRDDGGIPAPADSSGQRAMPFWSAKSRAERVIAQVPAYVGFAVQEIPLDEFLQRWLPGLTADSLLVGLNWSGERATGYDTQPRAVAASLRSASRGHR